MSTQFDRELYGYRYVEVRRGDSLQKIAARELGDAGRWYELIAINDLLPPFVSDTPAGPRVAVAGQAIMVPAPTRPEVANTNPDQVFEADMALNRGRLEVEDGDFKVVTGRSNLRQALKHRVDTARGELLYHLDYGSLVQRMLGAVNGPTKALLCAQYARAAVAADPRIARIRSAVADAAGDTTRITVVAEPISGNAVEVSTTAQGS